MNEIENFDETADFIFYSGPDGSIRVEVIVGNETVWLNQKSLAEVFDVDRSVIAKHISNILKEGELDEVSTCANIAQVQIEGGREVTRNVSFYSLDMIIAVGYRVSSYHATQFRIWATKVLKEYLLKGFALDDERLKQGKTLFGKDYFNELLERIREIRASERRFYEKITDIYSQCSIDYDKNAPITHTFYATVQNKLHWAIHKHTASELIKLRANAKIKNMGLTTWKGAGYGGKILKSDVSVAKNYLTKDEISNLNRLVTMYLDFAENMAQRQLPMKMQDWVKKLDSFLEFNEYDILHDAGRVKHDVAKATAEAEYEKFRKIQDKEWKSDFDKVTEQIKQTDKLPDDGKRIETNDGKPIALSKTKKLLTIDTAEEEKNKTKNKPPKNG